MIFDAPVVYLSLVRTEFVGWVFGGWRTRSGAFRGASLSTARCLSGSDPPFPIRDERLLLVNAWNEWAEVAHLKPDRIFQYNLVAQHCRCPQDAQQFREK